MVAAKRKRQDEDTGVQAENHPGVTRAVSAREAVASRRAAAVDPNSAIQRASLDDPESRAAEGHVSALEFERRISGDYDSESGMSRSQSPTDQPASSVSNNEMNASLVLSSWMPNADNQFKSTEKEEHLKLEYNDVLTIVGQYYLSVRYGTISIAGAILNNKSGRNKVLAPALDILPTIRCVSGDWAEIVLSSVDEAEDLDKLSAVIPTIEHAWRCKCEACTLTQRIISYTKLRRAVDFHSRPTIRQWTISTDWEQLLAQMQKETAAIDQTALIAIGAWSSTDTARLCQAAVNTILGADQSQSSKVILFDMDHEMPLMGYPGHVTLATVLTPILQPSWCVKDASSAKIDRSHVVMQSASRQTAIDMMQSMIERARQLAGGLSGSRILVRLPPMSSRATRAMLATLRAHILLIIDSEAVISAAAADLAGDAKILSCQPQSSVGYPTSDPTRHHNQLWLQMYFHTCCNPHLRTLHEPLSNMRPRVISYAKPMADGEIGTDFLCFVLTRERPPMYDNLLRDLLDGTIVSVGVLPSSHRSEILKIERGFKDSIPYCYADETIAAQANVVGLALIRAIDADNQLVQVVYHGDSSCLDPAQTILLAGTIATPLWAYTEDQSNLAELSISRPSAIVHVPPWASVARA